MIVRVHKRLIEWGKYKRSLPGAQPGAVGCILGNCLTKQNHVLQKGFNFEEAQETEAVLAHFKINHFKSYRAVYWYYERDLGSMRDVARMLGVSSSTAKCLIDRCQFYLDGALFGMFK